MGCEGVKGGGKKRGRRAGRLVWVNSSVVSDREVSEFSFRDDGVGDDGIRDGGSEGKSKENDVE
jgi:hypothetical protein